MRRDSTGWRLGRANSNVFATVALISGSLAGCVHPSAPLVVSDPDPSVKIPAIKKEVLEKDLSERAQLVKALDSDDPAVRFFAIGALQRLTGETFGYVYYQEDAERRPATLKWRAWLERQGPATGPATSP